MVVFVVGKEAKAGSYSLLILGHLGISYGEHYRHKLHSYKPYGPGRAILSGNIHIRYLRV
jgi:hypothetical protein